MAIYAGTIFLSAFLLFLVQPIIAKQILPWFGGAATVWATCLVFFQTVLLFGYAYADWITRRLGARRQVVLHVALLAASLLVLPIVPEAGWKPAGEENPSWRILGLLAATIGLPYFLLSTTSPLLQAWFARRFHHAAPYRLFALSNLASLLALLAYPVAVEPWISVAAQSHAWSGIYALFAVLCAATAVLSARAEAGAEVPAASGAVFPPALRDKLLWLGLAAMGSFLLLAVTNHITQNIASIPFLWIVPLSLYLVSFILCFDHPRWYARGLFMALTAAALTAMAAYIDSLDLKVAIPLYAAGLFVCCMFCHGELARLKPHPRYLTTYYLMIALGGAVGALLVGIMAPNLLRGYYEIGIGLTACALLLLARTLDMPRLVRGVALSARAVAVVAVASTAYFVVRGEDSPTSQTRMITRNFYGVVRTAEFREPVPFRAMYHGPIIHGGQYLEAKWQRAPSLYFGPTSGIGRIFAAFGDEPRRVGVIGLGVGVYVAYGRAGDVFRLYEIDPRVVEIARRDFSFLADTPARVEIVLGDARLSLEREPDQRFDVLAMDAFSGDSIPMHLLTREAMATYMRHLKPGGVLIFQATNRFVDITHVVARLALEYGLTAVLVSDIPDAQRTPHDYWLSSTDQILVTRNRAFLDHPLIGDAAEPLTPRPDFPVWTDDFHNLLRVLK